MNNSPEYPLNDTELLYDGYHPSIFTQDADERIAPFAISDAFKAFAGSVSDGNCTLVMGVGCHSAELSMRLTPEMTHRIDDASLEIGDVLDSRSVISREDAIRYQFGQDEEHRIKAEFLPKECIVSKRVLLDDYKLRVSFDLSGHVNVNSHLTESLTRLKSLLFGEENS